MTNFDLLDLFGKPVPKGPTGRSPAAVKVEGNRGYDREDADFYPTPYWVTAALLAQVALRGPVWEPFCGTWEVANVLERAGHEVMGSDLHDRGHGVTGVDFLQPGAEAAAPGFHSIVTNSPYGKEAIRFVRRALKLIAVTGGQAAFLLPHQFDTGNTYRDCFRDCPAFALKLSLTRRIKWFASAPGEGASPSKNHAWYLWDARHDGPAVLDWGE